MRTLRRENNDDPYREFRIHQHTQRIGKLLRQEKERIRKERAAKVAFLLNDPAPTFTYCKTCLENKTEAGRWVLEGIYGSTAHWSEPMRNGCCKRTTVCKKTLTLLVGLDHVMKKWGRQAEPGRTDVQLLSSSQSDFVQQGTDCPAPRACLV